MNNRPPVFSVSTDGSGWNDTIAGYCAIVTYNKTGQEYTVMGSATNYTVPRIELFSIVEALRFICEHEHFFDGISVLVETDNEGVAHSASFKAKRITHRDLWLLFDYYEDKMSLTVNHISRDTAGKHQTCDYHASTLRVSLVEYLKT